MTAYFFTILCSVLSITCGIGAVLDYLHVRRIERRFGVRDPRARKW